MADTEATRVANEVIAAFSVGDWVRFQAQLAPTIVYDETGTGRHVKGAEGYVVLCQGWRDAFPDAIGTVGRVVADGPIVAQEVTWEGTQTGPLPTPGGVLPPSGRRIAVAATLWYTVRDGWATAIRHHLDLLTMLQQIGALPV